MKKSMRSRVRLSKTSLPWPNATTKVFHLEDPKTHPPTCMVGKSAVKEKVRGRARNVIKR